MQQEFEGVGIFAPLLGGHNPLDRSRWSKTIEMEKVDGYCLLGLHENGATPQNLDAEHIRKCVLASLVGRIFCNSCVN